MDCKEIQLVYCKGNQSWISIGRTDVEAEIPIRWPPDSEKWLIWKDPDAGKDWREEEKGTTEDEMVGWHHQLPELAQTHVYWASFNHLILCHPLLLLPSILPNIRVFSNESVLHIRWPKYWSFSFSISPSKKYSRLISFRIDWVDLLVIQGTL